jgi:hypothetical protein
MPLKGRPPGLSHCVNWCGALFGPTCRSEDLDLQPRRLVQDPNAICGSDSIPF